MMKTATNQRLTTLRKNKFNFFAGGTHVYKFL